MAAESRGYFLSVSGSVRDRLMRLNDLALSNGVLAEWIATMRLALERLETEPEEAGDPLFRMKHLFFTNYRLLVDRVCVFYAIHDWERLVIIKKVVPVLDHPLEGMV